MAGKLHVLYFDTLSLTHINPLACTEPDNLAIVTEMMDGVRQVSLLNS